MTVTWSIRDAVVDDADAIGRAHVRAWQHAYRGVMPDEYLDGLRADERADMWRPRLARTDLPPLRVAVVDGEAVGFAVVGNGELYAVNLDPDHWGAGIGRALVRDAAEHLASLGFDEAVLWVVPQNVRARTLYESEGWVDDGATRDDTLLGVTVTDMRYRLRIRT